MPLYVYRTDDGFEFETVQSMDAAPYTEYTDDNGELHHVKRVPQAVQAVFKGSGWARG
jgi:predicted nucleic acid-binding Zn ribbon protein